MISDVRPVDFNPSLEVVGCYVMREGRFVLLQRHPQKRQPLKWGVVAGRMEAGEDYRAAMARELREEVGLNVNTDALQYREVLYVRSDDKNDPFDLLYHVFRIDVPGSMEARLSQEHVNFCWVTPGEALQMDLIHDLDACIIRHFI